jgi:aminoglycoside phosphotransferase (APT) family kinase protein
LPGVKPEIATDWARALAERELGVPVKGVRELEGGEIARTFAVTAGADEYVLRFNRHMGANFEKEAYLSRLAAPARIPMAPIVAVGRTGDLHFSITRLVEGTRADQLSEEEQEAFVPELLATLEAIHRVDVRRTTGYGTFGDDGAGLFSSWRADPRGRS